MTPIQTVAVVLAVVQVVYLALLRVGYRRAHRQFTLASRSESLPPVSVVVAARNEAGGIGDLLDALSAQTHPSFEVVLVDDGSEDETLQRMTIWANGRTGVQIFRNPGSGKKQAVTHGIQNAKHELLAFTDADCVPGPEWLATLASLQSPDIDVVLVGFGPLVPMPGALGKLMRYDALHSAFLTAATIGLNRPFMAVARNLCYSKATFAAAGGHRGRSVSGDDDLFVQAVHQAGCAGFRYVFDERAFVPSPAPENVSEWFRQKRRHTSAGRDFPLSVQLHLALIHGSATLLWLAPLVASWWGAGFLLVRLVALSLALRKPLRQLHGEDLVGSTWLLELGYAAYTSVVPPLGFLFGGRRW
ncbi:MAG: glycosyltransferase involved in cell wall biosynthesis [Rhodothermales bacterium]|jgi:glycosyltransferase involved in cell wall biosynthesis